MMDQYGKLPVWDLTDLYPAMDSPAVDADLAKLARLADEFREDYDGNVRLAAKDAAKFVKMLKAREAIAGLAERLGSFAHLQTAVDSINEAFTQFDARITEAVSEQARKLVFLPAEICHLTDADMEQLYQDAEAARYKPWLEHIRSGRRHRLSDELEEFITDMSVNDDVPDRLYAQTVARMRVEVRGEEMTVVQAKNRLMDADRSVRRSTHKAIDEQYREHLHIFALIANSQAKRLEIENRWRRHDDVAGGRHRDNRVEPETVAALAQAVKDSYAATAHRYYDMKRGWLGLDRLRAWDRNAPVPGDAAPVIKWPEAARTVSAAYHEFSPRLGGIADQFFDNQWIHAPEQPGKRGGAFAASTCADSHSYILLNYMGRRYDVLTLAHELGHGVHQQLAAAQGDLLSRTPLTLAETASVFGEMLTFKRMLRKETDPRLRRVLLAGKVEDMLSTSVRQISFYEFERRVHTARREGELTQEQFGDLWIAVQEESLGPAFKFGKSDRAFWAQVPHFVHYPFYVYAYAFGECLVNSLYAAYEAGTVPDFPGKFEALLAAGGTLHHAEAVRPFGLDTGDPAFWTQGMGVISNMIDELEAME